MHSLFFFFFSVSLLKKEGSHLIGRICYCKLPVLFFLWNASWYLGFSRAELLQLWTHLCMKSLLPWFCGSGTTVIPGIWNLRIETNSPKPIQSSPVSRRAGGEYSLLIKFSAFESFWVTFSHLTNHKWQGSVISTRWQRVYKVHHGTSLLPSARKSKCSTNMLSQSILVLRISPGQHRLERENSLHWT